MRKAIFGLFLTDRYNTNTHTLASIQQQRENQKKEIFCVHEIYFFVSFCVHFFHF